MPSQDVAVPHLSNWVGILPIGFKVAFNVEPLNKAYWQEKADSIAALGQRVLAFAVKPVKSEHTVLEHTDIESTLTLLGMVGMIDG